MEMLDRLPDRVASLESQVVLLRGEMHAEFSALRIEIRSGDEETRRHMRVLHEEVISRIALIDDRRNRQ